MNMFRMGGQKLPPIPYLISTMVATKKPRHPPEDEREIKRDDAINELPPDQRKGEVSCQLGNLNRRQNKTTS